MITGTARTMITGSSQYRYNILILFLQHQCVRYIYIYIYLVSWLMVIADFKQLNKLLCMNLLYSLYAVYTICAESSVVINHTFTLQ